MDTQVSGATLHHLGKKYNQTIHKYALEEGHVKREYLLDVNSWIWERERGDGMNIIDARWIDTRNGLFIDITGLSKTHPDTKPREWSCKNNHRYNTSDLYPMRESIFEGAVVKVPYAYDRVLIQEYKERALVVTEFEGYVTCAYASSSGYLTYARQVCMEQEPGSVVQDADATREGASRGRSAENACLVGCCPTI